MLKDGMKIEARHVRRKLLPQYIDMNHLKRERKVSESLNTSASVTQLAKKRLSAEMGQLSNSSKRKLEESVSLRKIDSTENLSVFWGHCAPGILSQIFLFSLKFLPPSNIFMNIFFHSWLLSSSTVRQTIRTLKCWWIQRPLFHRHNKLNYPSPRDDLMAFS